MRAITTVALILCLGACKGGAPGDDVTPAASAQASAPAAAASTEAAPEPPAVPPPAKAVARSVKEDNDLYNFEYSYPAAAAAIPSLKAWFDADLAKQKAKLVSDARHARSEAKNDGYPYHGYSAAWDWQVVTDLPGWISLSTEIDTYTGGAHGNSTFDTLLWDKNADIKRKPLDLFTSPAALSAAIQKPFCAVLDKAREKKRGEPVPPGSTAMFYDCIDPVKEIVILGSSNHQTFDRIGVLVPPYDAGSYAEGSFDVTVPVTDAVLRVVKPEYRSSFSVNR